MTVGVCVKWVAATPGDDDRFAGISPADAAALEWALRTGELCGQDVRVVTAGGPAADTALRDAVAVGAGRVLRIDLAAGLDSRATAAALAGAVADCRLVWCGDYSLDRGSGSVPAFLAAELGVAQALGLVEVDVAADGALHAVRRLDGGRRERLRVDGTERAVVSVEGSTARIRRASLRASLAARCVSVEVVPGPGGTEVGPPVMRPFRPRARVLPAPAGQAALDRLRTLTDAGSAAAARGEIVELAPEEAADRILAALAAWGELPGGSAEN